MLYRYNKHSREKAICNRSETSKFAKKQVGNACIYNAGLKQIYLADTPTDEMRSILEVGSEGLHKITNWSSKKEHKENALALGADERRGKLR